MRMCRICHGTPSFLSYTDKSYTINVKQKLPMRKLFILSAFALCSIAATAVPAKRGIWKMLTLPDGTEVRAELCGDEYASFWRTAEGDAYVKHTGTDLFVKTSLEAINMKAAEKRKASDRRRIKRATGMSIGSSSNVNSGSRKGLIILVQFPNMKFKTAHDNTYYNNVANTVGFTNSEGYRGSVHDYFLSQSNGKFDLTFDVAGPYTLANNYEYYGADYNSYKDINVREMITEACTAANKDVDFSVYDWDGDGEVEQIYVLYAGEGQASGGDANTVWPHESALYPSITLDNTRLYTYACGSELVLGGAGGIGTFCHEFSHCLGLPDMYDTDYSGAYGMGPYSLMCSGSYNGNSMLPANYTAYELMFSGWQQPVELTGEVEINGMKAIGDGGETYVFYNKGYSNEFYMLENRQLTGWDAALPAAGLVITHVDYNRSSWANNNVNNDPEHQRCYVFHADNGSNDKGVPYPNGINNKLTDTSIPAATLFNNNNGKRLMNYPITEIVNENGLISFKAGFAEVVYDFNGPSVDPADAVFYESFDNCAGQGGNDNFWGTEVTFADLQPNNDGWYYQYGYGADRCAKFGRSAKDGNTATPIMALDGNYDLYFKAAPYATGETGLTLALNGKGSMEQTSFVMEDGKWTAFHTTFTANGDARIVFRPEKHFFLDEVIIKKNTSTGITGIEMQPDVHVKAIYSIDGRYVGTDMNSLKKGIYIIGGKKIVR